MIPDVVFSGLCGITCLLNFLHGDFISERWCKFQSVYAVFGITANAWLNGVITVHLHRMLTFSKNCQRYSPPNRKRVCLESMVVYLWSLFVATWIFIPFCRIDLGCKVELLACLWTTTERQQSFGYLVFVPCLAGIPVLHGICVVIDVQARKLLPKKAGNARNLCVYFGRLIWCS